MALCMCPVHSALTRKVSSWKRRKVSIHAVCGILTSDQLLFLGSTGPAWPGAAQSAPAPAQAQASPGTALVPR
jgi:uncharacterized iron-regulated membrane protein